MNVSVHAKIAASLLGLAAAAPVSAQPQAPAQVQSLPRPVASGLSHWDDHWFIWLPHHPVYESIEVAMRNPDAGGRRDVWVWLSERAGDKRQVHYRNNPRLLRYPPSTLRDFDFRVGGEPGQPRSLRLAFTDEHDLPISVSVDVDPSQTLRPDSAAFTAQGGHSGNLLFLLFYRGRSAEPTNATAVIGGTNYAFARGESMGALRFRWGYSHGIDIGLFSYGTSEVLFGPGGFLPVDGHAGRFATALPDGGRVTLAGDGQGRLADYVHDKDGRALRVHFEPPLPACAGGEPGARSAFSISLPELADAVRGTVETRCGPDGAVYAWRPASPDWAARQPFTSTLRPIGDGRFSLSVGRGATSGE